MTDRSPAWSGSTAEQSHCAACRQLYPNSALDQRLWCPDCVEALERKMRRGRHLTGLLFTAPFAVWVALEGSYEVLPLYAWLLPLAAAYYLGYRVGGELVKGYVRWRRARGPADTDSNVDTEERDETA